MLAKDIQRYLLQLYFQVLQEIMENEYVRVFQKHIPQKRWIRRGKTNTFQPGAREIPEIAKITKTSEIY